MNTFKFIGNIIEPKNDFVRKTSSGRKVMKLIIKQNENNSAFVQIAADDVKNDGIYVFLKDDKTKRYKVPYERRLEDIVLNKVSYGSKYIINLLGSQYKDEEFICKDDFINYIYQNKDKLLENNTYEVKGEYLIKEYNGKFYNNFNVKSIRLLNNARHEFTMSLDLFYNNESLDETDKRNKFILNAYISQYSFQKKDNVFYPLQTMFVTNRFDFKNPTDIEVIKHRKANLNPPKEIGFVKATWEAQYVKGAQVILPPLETLPKDIQFEIKNAGRDIREYTSKIITDAKEVICLTRPNNTLSKNGEVYKKVELTENEFKSKIYSNDFDEEQTIDKIAIEDVLKNPFNK